MPYNPPYPISCNMQEYEVPLTYYLDPTWTDELKGSSSPKLGGPLITNHGEMGSK